MKNRKVEVTRQKRFPQGAVFALMYSSGEYINPSPTHIHTHTRLEPVGMSLITMAPSVAA